MKRSVSLAFGLVLALALSLPVAAANFPARIDLPDGWRPEGIDSGSGTTVFVGSLADGAIWKGDVRTGLGSIFVAGIAGKVAVGVDYDPGTDRLWVAGGETGEVRAYDATSGALLATYQFSPAGFLNDLVATERAVYVTDSRIQQLDVVPLGPGGALPPPSAATTLPLTGEIAYVPGQFNANGITATREWLILVQSVTGQLFRVDPATGVARDIDLGGASAASGDGLELQGDRLFVVQNFFDKVAVFRLGALLQSATHLGDLTSAGLDIPTTAAISAGRLWAVNARFTTPPGPDVEYWITRLPTQP